MPNIRRHLGTLATSMKTALSFKVIAAASAVVAESPVEARPPPGSKGCAMVAVPAQRAFLEADLPLLKIGHRKLLLYHYDP